MLKNLLSEKDFRGNNPVILCLILHHNKDEDPIYLEMLKILLESGANYKDRDKNQWTPLSIAVSYGNKEVVRLLYKFYLKRNQEKFNNRAVTVSNYFKKMPDFHMEIKWKVSIPLFSFLCPHDVLKIWKKGIELRSDFTFVDYKKLSVIRNPNSLYLKHNKTTNKMEFFKVDREKKNLYNLFEPLDEDEIELILDDLMTKKRMNGSFKMMECKLEETKEFFDSTKNIIEEVNGFQAQKFNLNLKVILENNPTQIIEYNDLTENNYLNQNIKDEDLINYIKQEDAKELKDNLEEGLHIKNKAITSSLNELQKEKTLKAYVWVIENNPLNSQDLVNLLEGIGPANQFMDKVKEFFEHPDLQELIKKNGFPIKIQIPYNLFIDLTFSFKQFKKIENDDTETVMLFHEFDSYKHLRRRDCQKLDTNYKKRMAYANIR